MSEYRRIGIDGTTYYGKHLLLTARACNENILDKQAIATFIRTLVDKIDMVAFGECIVERFGSGIEIGISAAQLIETSLISMHTNDGARDMYLDVFSCKWFSEETVRQYVEEVFAPRETTHQVILR
jgi:S-adenosylmethionine/arginine decarboxylase-like enzyme